MSRFDETLLARALEYVGRPRVVQRASDDYASAVDIAAALCKRFEGFAATAYLCPAGVPTIGYGATHYLDGRRVTLTDAPISRETAERLLLRQIEAIYLPALIRQCPSIVEQSAERIAALIDWTFNLGEGNLRASTLRRKVNAGEWDAVPSEIRKWIRGGGRVLRGLVLRRDAEAAMI